jgi:hypothetical protein
MSLYVEHPCGECEWYRYDSFHDEKYCGNSDCSRSVTEFHWDCENADKYFKELVGESGD